MIMCYVQTLNKQTNGVSVCMYCGLLHLSISLHYGDATTYQIWIVTQCYCQQIKYSCHSTLATQPMCCTCTYTQQEATIKQVVV